MTRELLILRHAEASADASETDFDRALTPRGVMSCHVVAHQILKSEKSPELILSSSAVRTTQTILRVCKLARLSIDHINWSPTFYNCDIDVWLKALSEIPDDVMRLMIVGHNPAIHSLVEHLSGGPIESPVRGSVVPPGTLFELDVATSGWNRLSRGCATVAHITRPSANMPLFDPDH